MIYKKLSGMPFCKWLQL